MDQINETINGNEYLSLIVSMLKTVLRAILPMIGLSYFTKYFEEDEAAADEA